MSRQKRFNLGTHNFNFEEYDRYTRMYEEAEALDKDKSTEFYRLVKYVKEKTGTEEARTDAIVQDFHRKFKLDLIEVPEEFKDLDTENFVEERRGRKVKRKTILTRSSKSVYNYDAWRVFDVSPTINDGK